MTTKSPSEVEVAGGHCDHQVVCPGVVRQRDDRQVVDGLRCRSGAGSSLIVRDTVPVKPSQATGAQKTVRI